MRRWFCQLLPPVLLLLAGLSLGGMAAERDTAAWLPFLLSTVLLGLPHGAADCWVLARVRPGRGGRGRAVAVYAALLAAAAALVVLSPALALAGFLLGSAWHFGMADSSDLARFFGATGRPSVLLAFGRGSLLFGLSFAFDPERMVELGGVWLQLLGDQPFERPLARHLESVGFGIVGVSLGVTGWAAFRLRHSLGHGALVWWWVEAVILGFVFWSAPAVFAFGLYFLLWHSVRHLDHLDLGSRGLWGRAKKLYLRAAPFFIPSLIVLAGAAVLSGSTDSPERFGVLLLVLFAIVTPAHEWLVHRELHAPR